MPVRGLAPARPCARCGIDFCPTNASVAVGIGHYCSRTCGAARGPNPDKWATRDCRSCGKSFRARTSETIRGSGHYCSLACYHMRQRDAEAVFWENVEKSDDCWLWKPAIGTDRYGDLRVGAKRQRAHRFSYELHHGPIPPGMFVCHRCDCPACVNPTHLFLGTCADNSADMVAKDRGPRGERQGGAILSEAAAVAIRQRRDAGEAVRDLAHEYGVTAATIYAVAARKNWKYLDRTGRAAAVLRQGRDDRQGHAAQVNRAGAGGPKAGEGGAAGAAVRIGVVLRNGEV